MSLDSIITSSNYGTINSHIYFYVTNKSREETFEQRKKLHMQMFEYMQALRANEDVTEIQKEIQMGIAEMQKMMLTN